MPGMRTAIALLLLLGWIWPAGAASLGANDENVECSKSAAFLVPADPLAARRHYAPDREVEVLHLALEVTPDFERRTVEGKATMLFKGIGKPVRELKLDAVDLNIHDVACTRKLASYQVGPEQVTIAFAEPLEPGEEATTTITYSAEPAEGLYFRTPAQGYRPGDTHLFTQGEEIEARHWYPCFDSPNEKFTSEVTCRVPQGMTVISNGRLVSSETNLVSGLQVVHWSQDQPHANYLITLAAGYFKKLEDTYKDIPLAFFTPASEIGEAASSFGDTKDMMKFFEEDIGVPYPWPKYYQVCVNDFVAGGMENTSATTLTDGALFTAATGNIRDSDGLVSHELAHQWFGDLVTCKDWSHIWLNEGFATYYATLYSGHKEGRDALLYGLYGRARQLTSLTNDLASIVRREYAAPREMFGALTYGKASMVLHMLRCELGDDLYRRCVKAYLERHRYGSVVTEDLRQVIEELSGRSFDQFFDQWLYHGHFPELEASYSWEEESKLAKISIRQTQELGPNVLLFNFPLGLRLEGRFGTADRTARVSEKEQDFYFALDSEPSSVRLNPDCSLLAKIDFAVSREMLDVMVTNRHDVLARVEAVGKLADEKDGEAVAQLKGALERDAFYGVRLEAARALASIHTDEALEALLAATNQPDARVRLQVATSVDGFYCESACQWTLKMLERETNTDILAAGLTGLGGYAKPEVHDVLSRFLRRESFRSELAGAAIAAMRLQDDPVWIAPLVERLSGKDADFTSHGFSNALEAVAYLARKEEKRDQARQLLLDYVNHKRRTIQLASMQALGTLGDPGAIAVLEKFAAASKKTPQRAVAERAVEELRAARKPADDFKNLRQEVLDLEKTSRELREEIDDLKQQLEAATKQLASSRKGKKAPDKK
jgi:aminopeptidase N